MKLEPNKLYSSREAAPLLDVTEETIKKYCRKGLLAAKRVGPKKRWHITGSALAKKREEWGLDELKD